MADSHAAVNNAHTDLSSLAGGLAIVTGGASGIGYALATAAIDHGMHAVVVDIDADAVQTAESNLQKLASNAQVETAGYVVDVSTEDDVLNLKNTLHERFPDTAISLVCCNAGVGAGGGVLSAKDVDWDFILGVNVKGVANFVRTFVPEMLNQNAPGAIMATSSQDGLCAAQGVYGVSKHACVALMEALYQELSGRLSVHVLCPNVVATNIVKSGTHRPERFGGPIEGGPMQDRIADRFKSHGMPPSQCAEYVFNAIQSGDFYVLAEADEDPGHVSNQAKVRMEAILNRGRPFRPPSEFIARVFNLRAP